MECRRIFDRVVASDFSLPRLQLAPAGESPDVTIRESGMCWNDGTAANGGAREFTRIRCGEDVLYRADGIGLFRIHQRGRQVTYSLAPGASPSDVQHVLTGPALVMALQLQDDFFLHAASAVKDGGMLALSAPHGAGKSTLAASLIDAGLHVGSDDVLPLRVSEGTICGLGGHPWIKLWDDALVEFGQDAKDFDEVLEGYGKRVVPNILNEQARFPLRAVFLLNPHGDFAQKMTITEIAGLDAVLALMANVYSPEIMVGELAVHNLDFATRIAAQVPVRVVSYYRSFENLPNIRDAILRDFDEVVRA